MKKRLLVSTTGLLLALLAAPSAGWAAAGQQPDSSDAVSAHTLVERYCVTCHNARLRTADLALAGAELADA
ncbi:MAG: hypothetical protein OXF27_17950, partial [Acidobacteria bacterium]|nr:hypothetical protein [Acidobacteriota bacterium]